MAYKIKVNRVEYELKDGFSIKEELNETLDSATVQFNTYNGEIDAVPFDDVEIYDDENKIEKKYFLVDTTDDEIYSFGVNFETDNHNYTVALFSETKELERITLPNCSVTQPIEGYATKSTVWDEINRFCTIFLPSVKVYDSTSSTGFSYHKALEIDAAVQTKFSQIVCPEFQWNNPTLREVLNDLMSTADCIVVVRNKVISYYSLAEKGNPIDTSKLSLSKKTMSSVDYAGELTIDMQNAIGKNVTVVCEKKGLRSTEGEMTTSNCKFITQQPIYNIKSCKISYFLSTESQQYSLGKAEYFKEIDITDYVVEKGVYDIASSGRYNPFRNYGYSGPTAAMQETAKGYKHYLLYYTRGSNEINGWGETMKYTSGGTSIPHISWIIRILGESFQSNQQDISLGVPSQFAWLDFNHNNDIRGIHVDLVYETISGHAMHIGKYLPIRHPENRIFDNQSSSYVDINHQSIFEYAKINRLGNKIREIQGEYSSEDDIPQLGDYIGDEILFSKEVIYYDDILYFKGYLTPNYVLKDYFTGVLAKRRSWQLASEEDALSRSIVTKFYVESSFSRKTDAISNLNNTRNNAIGFGAIHFCGAAPHSANTEVKYCVAQPKATSTTFYPDSTHGYQVDLDKEVQGMSLCFNFQFMDNVVVDYNLNNDDGNLVSGLYRYCTKAGKMVSINFGFLSYIDPGNGSYTFPSNHQTWSQLDDNIDDLNENMEEVMQLISAKPVIKTGSSFGASNVTPRFVVSGVQVQKDNREILKFAVQFEYCSDTKDIVLTQKMIELCSLYKKESTTYLILYVSTNANDSYSLNDTEPKGSSVGGAMYSITSLSLLSCRITISSSLSWTNVSCWSLVDPSDGKIVLAVNGSSKNVYLNLLRSRDTNIYSDFRKTTIVGTIANNVVELENIFESIEVPQIQSKFLRRNVTSLISLEELEEE